MESRPVTNRLSPVAYGRYLMFIAGMGGLLYGIDVGIISAALLYLGKTISLSLEQTSLIVAAVLGGSMFSSLIAGVLSDWLGRKTMMILSGLLFIASVVLIVGSHGFATLFTGRLLQGASGGFIAVVVPLYLAECLGPADRGKGSAIFQLMLTIGIVIASATGWYFTNHAVAAITAAHGNQALILAANNHAWRGMFLSVIYPGAIFFAGSFFLSESPRWLFRRGRQAAALRALERSSTPAEAALQMREMEAAAVPAAQEKTFSGDLLKKKYVVPFVLACVILACNQATGINSVLSYLVIILKQAGMSATHATQGDFLVKSINVLMTVVAVALIDRKGRKFLLVIGTSGIILALGSAALIFHSFEKQRVDVKPAVIAATRGDRLSLPLATLPTRGGNMALSVSYHYGAGEKSATALSTDSDPVLTIAPDTTEAGKSLVVDSASLQPVPSEHTGWLIALCLALFIAAFAVGPGVVVWLALSELMPTRIRSAGMGIALLVNQGVSTVIAAVFLPVVSHYGYAAMFLFWTLCTVVYLITAAFFLPETKGKTLEEIELAFAK
jgi:SP family myo-inositol transporter-like MFS transporter 13